MGPWLFSSKVFIEELLDLADVRLRHPQCSDEEVKRQELNPYAALTCRIVIMWNLANHTLNAFR